MIEKVQRRATKLVMGLQELPYGDRLRALKLPSLSYRRIRGDMIETYKILNGKYDCKPEDIFKTPSDVTLDRTRGHDQKLYKHRPRYNIRKHSFSYRVVDLWNSLPPSVIKAQSVRAFESRLDKFWMDQDIKYDYKSKVVKGLNIHYIDEESELVSQV